MNCNLPYLRQGVALLERLDDELFKASAPGLESGGVGPQFRHVIDYYRCFLRDVSSGRIDYDRRERDEVVETQRDVCIARLRELAEVLDALDIDALPAELRVRADADPSLPIEEQFAPSSVRRELMFLTSHTIHHFALIAVTLQARGVSPGSEFGVAPSTLRHWKSSQGFAR